MTDKAIEILLIILLIFTPIAFGSQVLWAFSLMELGILLIIILWAVQRLGYRPPVTIPRNDLESEIRNPKSEIPLTIFLLSLFLGIVLLQIIPLPAGIIKIISPKTYEIRNQLSLISPANSHQLSVKSSELRYRLSARNSGIANQLSVNRTNNESPITNNGLQIRNPQSQIRNPQSPSLKPQSVAVNPNSEIRNPKSPFLPLSFFPLATKIEFLKWLALAGLFVFLLHWRLPDNRYRIINRLIIAIFLVGVFESLYGIFEFFSGHHHILNLDSSGRMLSVTGTFVNRNYFAGYLIMVIPLGFGFLFSRGANQPGGLKDWRHRLSSLDGKTLLIGFGLILMILGLLLSASRMGIVSLLLSFSLLILLFNLPQREKRVSRASVLIFGMALLWAGWIGLDAVISRFFSVSEGLEGRWVMWTSTFGIFKDFPVLGSGLGTFTELFPMYRFFHARGLFTHAENDFLQLASEVGLLGAGSLSVLFSFLIYRAVKGLRSLAHAEPQRYIAIGGLVGILALMLHSTMERNIQVPANAFLYTVIWAMVLRIASGSSGQPKVTEEE